MGFRVRVHVPVVVTLALVAAGCASPLLGDAAGGVARGAGVPAPTDCGQPKGTEPMGAADPATVGLDPNKLNDAVHYSTQRGSQSVRVYRHGCLVAKSGNDPITEQMRLQSWSMTKGMVAVVVGRAVQMGVLGVDDPIGKHLPGLDPEKANLTVRQFLNQTTGLRFAWANDLAIAGSEDSVARTLERPLGDVPGEVFIYAQTTVTVLVALVEASTGMDFQDFTRAEVMDPLGIPRNQWRWGRDGSGRTHGFAFLEMAPVAWARVGQLMLDRGAWQGQQLIGSDYIAAGSVGTPAEPDYGFLWRTNTGPDGKTAAEAGTARSPYPDDAVSFEGLFDQRVTLIPSLDMVVVRMGLPTEMFGDPIGESPGIRPKWEYRFSRMLMQSVADQLVPDPGPWKYQKEELPVEPDQVIAFDLYPFG